jgi:hypothetical protein
MNALSAPSFQSINTLASQPSRGVVVPPTVENSASQITNNPIQASNQSSNQPSNQTTRPGETQQAFNASPNKTSQSATDQAQQQRQIEQVLAQLRARDQEVKTHEQAHLNTAGQYATGGIKYSYQTGPDGQKYAIGGSVGIDTAPIAGDPEATMQKARVVQRAALAPAQPSSQDMSVAAQASQMLMQAQVDLRTQKTEEQKSQQAQQTKPSTTPQSINSIDQAGQQKGIMDTTDTARNGFELRLALQQRPSNGIVFNA